MTEMHRLGWFVLTTDLFHGSSGLVYDMYESTIVSLDCFAFDLKLTQTRVFIKSNFVALAWL